jgi:gas vesicle protein
MAKDRRIPGRSLSLVALGYALGLLTAPRSGKRTRSKIKNSKDPVSDIEKELKDLYSQTKKVLAKLAADEPKLNENLKKLKEQAMSSQAKVKDLLSAIHGHDEIDTDLDTAINEAKDALKSLKQYLSK